MTMHTVETRTKGERVVTLPFTPNTAQDEFIHSGAPKTMIVASVAAGKTTALCMRAWMISWKYPGNKGMLARYTYDEIRDTIIPTWKKCVPKELMINPDCLDRKDLGMQTLLVHTQDPERPSEILFRNLEDPHVYESAELGWFALSQANDPKITRRMWDTLNERLRHPVPYHFAFAEANWGGNASKGGWIWDEFVNMKQGHLVTADTMVNWDNLPDDYKARLADLPKYRQMHSIYGCYDKDTEILTRSGWKRHEDLVVGEEVLSIDPAIGVSEYQPVERIWRYDWAGPMCRLYGRNTDLFVTPDHNVLVDRHSPHGTRILTGTMVREFRKARDVLTSTSNRFSIPRHSQWIGEEREYFSVPGCRREWRNGRGKLTEELVDAVLEMRRHGETFERIGAATGLSHVTTHKIATNPKIEITDSHRVDFKPMPVKMDTWLAFLGYYLSEGSIRPNRNEVAISQNWPDPQIALVLESLPWTFRRHGQQWEASSYQLWSYLSQLGGAAHKFIPREFMVLSSRQLRILLDALIRGDGSVRRTGHRYYYTSSPILAGNVQELFQKTDSAATITVRDRRGPKTIMGIDTVARYPEYIVCETRCPRTWTRNLHRATETYRGTVWCVTVPHHTVYVRRNGKATWCGQSWDPLIEVRGIPVFPEFKWGFHTPEDGSVGDVRKLFTQDRPVFRGIDVPGPGACTWCQMDERGRLLVGHELCLDAAIGTAEFADIVQSDSAQFFPGSKYLDYVDPAAMRVEQTSGKSNANVLYEKGLRPRPAGVQIDKRLQCVKDWLTMAVHGEAGLLIDPGCHRLIGAMQGGYNYPQIGAESGRYSPVPGKSSFSHIADALQYACHGVARLQYSAQREEEPMPMPAVWLGQLRRNPRAIRREMRPEVVSTRNKRDIRVKLPRIDW